jgi:hypothetical protein
MGSRLPRRQRGGASKRRDDGRSARLLAHPAVTGRLDGQGANAITYPSTLPAQTPAGIFLFHAGIFVSNLHSAALGIGAQTQEPAV